MLNVKSALTKLMGRTGVEYFTLTGYAGFDAWLGYGFYDKSTDTVRLYMFGQDSANIGTGVVLFTLPSKYKPPQNIGAPMAYSTASASGNYYALINTDGTVSQNASSSLRSFVAFAEYKLGG